MARRGVGMPPAESPFSLETWASTVDVTDYEGDGRAMQATARGKREKKPYLNAANLKEGQRQIRASQEHRMCGLVGPAANRQLELVLRKYGDYDPNVKTNLVDLAGSQKFQTLRLLLRNIEEDQLSFETMMQRCMADTAEGDFEIEGNMLDTRIAHPRRTIHDLPRPEDTLDFAFADDRETDEFFREQAEEDDLDALAMPIADLLYLIKAMRMYLHGDITLTTHNTDKRPPVINKQVLLEENSRLMDEVGKMVGVNQIMDDGLRASHRLAERVSALTRRRLDDFENKKRRLGREIDFLQAQMKEASSASASDAQKTSAKLRAMEESFAKRLRQETEGAEQRVQEAEKRVAGERAEGDRLRIVIKDLQDKLKEVDTLTEKVAELERENATHIKRVAKEKDLAAAWKKKVDSFEYEKEKLMKEHAHEVRDLKTQLAVAEAQALTGGSSSPRRSTLGGAGPEMVDQYTQTRNRNGLWSRLRSQIHSAAGSTERDAEAGIDLNVPTLDDISPLLDDDDDLPSVNRPTRRAMETQERSLMAWEDYLSSCTEGASQDANKDLLEGLTPSLLDFTRRRNTTQAMMDECEASGCPPEPVHVIESKLNAYLDSTFDAGIANIMELAGRLTIGLSGGDPCGPAPVPPHMRHALLQEYASIGEAFEALSGGGATVDAGAVVKALMDRGVGWGDAGDFVSDRWGEKKLITKQEFCNALGSTVLERLGSHIQLPRRGPGWAADKPPVAPEEHRRICAAVRTALVKAHKTLQGAFRAAHARIGDGTHLGVSMMVPSPLAKMRKGSKEKGKRGRSMLLDADGTPSSAAVGSIAEAAKEAGAEKASVDQWVEWVDDALAGERTTLTYDEFVNALDGNFSKLGPAAATGGAWGSGRLATTKDLRAMVSAFAADAMRQMTRSRRVLVQVLRRDLEAGGGFQEACASVASTGPTPHITPKPTPQQPSGGSVSAPSTPRNAAKEDTKEWGVQTDPPPKTTATGVQTAAGESEEGPFSHLSVAHWRRVETMDLDQTTQLLITAKGKVPRTGIPLQLQQLRLLVYNLADAGEPPVLDAELGDLPPAKLLLHMLDDTREMAKKLQARERARTLLGASNKSEFLKRQQERDKKQTARLKALSDRMAKERDRAYEAGYAMDDGETSEAATPLNPPPSGRKPVIGKERAAQIFLGGISSAKDAPLAMPSTEDIKPPPAKATVQDRELHLAQNLHKLLNPKLAALSAPLDPVRAAAGTPRSPKRSPRTPSVAAAVTDEQRRSLGGTPMTTLRPKPTPDLAAGGSSWSRLRTDGPANPALLNHNKIASSLGLTSSAASTGSTFSSVAARLSGGGATAVARPMATLARTAKRMRPVAGGGGQQLPSIV